MAGIHLHQIGQPGQHAPGSGFEQPFEMLDACHERVERMLRLLGKIREHVTTHGADEQARPRAGGERPHRHPRVGGVGEVALDTAALLDLPRATDVVATAVSTALPTSVVAR